MQGRYICVIARLRITSYSDTVVFITGKKKYVSLRKENKKDKYILQYLSL